MTGTLFEPNNVDQLANALVNLIGDKQKMEKMGEAGFEIAHEKFSAKKHVEQITLLYTKMLSI